MSNYYLWYGVTGFPDQQRERSTPCIESPSNTLHMLCSSGTIRSFDGLFSSACFGISSCSQGPADDALDPFWLERKGRRLYGVMDDDNDNDNVDDDDGGGGGGVVQLSATRIADSIAGMNTPKGGPSSCCCCNGICTWRVRGGLDQRPWPRPRPRHRNGCRAGGKGGKGSPGVDHDPM